MLRKLVFAVRLPRRSFSKEKCNLSSVKYWRQVSVYLGGALCIAAFVNAENRKQHVMIRPGWSMHETWKNELKSAAVPFHWDEDTGKYNLKPLFYDPHINYINGKGYEDGHNEPKYVIVHKIAGKDVKEEELNQGIFETRVQYIKRMNKLFTPASALKAAEKQPETP